MSLSNNCSITRLYPFLDQSTYSKPAKGEVIEEPYAPVRETVKMFEQLAVKNAERQDILNGKQYKSFEMNKLEPRTGAPMPKVLSGTSSKAALSSRGEISEEPINMMEASERILYFIAKNEKTQASIDGYAAYKDALAGEEDNVFEDTVILYDYLSKEDLDYYEAEGENCPICADSLVVQTTSSLFSRLNPYAKDLRPVGHNRQKDDRIKFPERQHPAHAECLAFTRINLEQNQLSDRCLFCQVIIKNKDEFPKPSIKEIFSRAINKNILNIKRFCFATTTYYTLYKLSKAAINIISSPEPLKFIAGGVPIPAAIHGLYAKTHKERIMIVSKAFLVGAVLGGPQTAVAGAVSAGSAVLIGKVIEATKEPVNYILGHYYARIDNEPTIKNMSQKLIILYGIPTAGTLSSIYAASCAGNAAGKLVS